MLLKALFFIVLIYFVVKTIARLIHAMKGDEPSSLEHDGSAGRAGSGTQQSYSEEDVEDAKFVDVS